MMRSRRFAWVAVAAAILIGVAWLIRDRLRPADPAESSTPAVDTRSQDPRPDEPTGPFPGEGLMREYGSSDSTPLDDLVALHRVVRGYFSIVKDQEKYPIGGNEDLAAALRGENAYKQAFLPSVHPAFDDDGRLVDRWDTPLFVHPVAARAIELRSAGPDRTLFTDDDLELGADGFAR
ncbi:hypothetical protein HAHE_18990 [Haloferula helveola]|uniref:Uncharacterized protein n=1 Tax=Haloferula helveola TaxID=490095 RepID=A0ABN6H327_9BACT|nr:hypothetical protein HAHE_18990 [Haloferula helveola]